MKNTVPILECYTGLDGLRSRRPRGEVDRSVPDRAEDRAIDAGAASRELKRAETRMLLGVDLAEPAGVGRRDGVVAGRCSTGAGVADGTEAGLVADDVDDAVRSVTESAPVNLSNRAGRSKRQVHDWRVGSLEGVDARWRSSGLGPDPCTDHTVDAKQQPGSGVAD